MISAIYLVILTCIFTQATNTPFVLSQNNATNTAKVYQNLHVAEQMIQTAKDIVSKNMQEYLPTDCEDLLTSGENKSDVYIVWPRNRILSGPISVYCDMETDGGGWTVIQRRGDFLHATDYFYQNWKEYKEGFGNLKEDFWLGNDYIYALSNQRPYSIRFDLKAFNGNTAYAVYANFWIDAESNNYTVHISGYSGTAGDAMTYNNDCKFSTKDRDNDKDPTNKCAQDRKGAWWYNTCSFANLNGEYHRGKPPADSEGITWKKWKTENPSLATTEMKIRKQPSWIK